jgi:hypothetical protein
LDASILEGDGHSSQNGCIAWGFLQKFRGTAKDPTSVHTDYDIEIRYFSSYTEDGTRREYKTLMHIDPNKLREVQLNELWSDKEMRER